MKKDVTNYISKCMECQRVKANHRNLVGFLQPFPILEWKWKVVAIDFITNFLRITRKHDSIKVVVGNLTMVTHFISVKLSHKVVNIA
jgi:hypothetical protein